MATAKIPKSPSEAKKYPRSSSVKNFKAWIIGWLPAIVGLATWVASFFGFVAPDLLLIFGSFSALALSVAIHELAHFVAARALGRKPWCVRLGYGKVVFDKEFESFRLVLQSSPYSGAVYFVKGTRHEYFATLFAAPLSNAILFLISLHFFRHSDDATAFTTIPTQMLFANGCLLLFTAIPLYTKSGEPNDGMKMFHLLRGTSPKSSPKTNSSQNFMPSWLWLVKHHSPDALLKKYREKLASPDISTEERCSWLDAFATGVLMFGANQFLTEADRYSAELLSLKPDDLSYKGTRGSVLIEKGDLNAGIAMLEEVMSGSTDANDLAISASFLALAYWKQGNRTEALRWLTTSREIDPRCASMRRISRFIEQETAPSAS
jgi:hypothetical protein